MIAFLDLLILAATPERQKILFAGNFALPFSPKYDIYGVAAQLSMLPETDDLMELARRFTAQMHIARQYWIPPGKPNFSCFWWVEEEECPLAL